MFYKHVDSPIGLLTIVALNSEISHLFLTLDQFVEYSKEKKLAEGKNQAVLMNAEQQLYEYFHEERRTFQLPLLMKGTPFQEKIWEQLLKIPYGHSCSYQEIALNIGNPNAVRAVGQANKANKLPIFVPCHRVIGKNQQLIGYAGNKTDMKATLLSLEKVSFT